MRRGRGALRMALVTRTTLDSQPEKLCRERRLLSKSGPCSLFRIQDPSESLVLPYSISAKLHESMSENPPSQ
eukprot:2934021-Amphidinium_carterae.1